MGTSSIKELVRDVSETVPGASIAASGFALALYAYEVNRMASFRNVEAGDVSAIVPSALSILVLIALAAAYGRRPRFRLHRHPQVGFAIAGMLTLTIFLLSGTFGPLSLGGRFCVGTVQRICEVLLMLCWTEVLATFPARTFAALVALAMLVLGVVNGLTGLFKQDAVGALVALLPLLSAACLYWFKDKRESFDTASRPLREADAEVAVDPSLWPRDRSARTRRSTMLLFLAPLVAYPFIFGHIHYAWLPAQDGSAISLAIQLAAAAGTVLAALVLLMLIAHFWGRRKINLYNLLILPVAGITLYLTSVLHQQWVFLYVVPLNLCQKMVLFLALLTPCLIPAKRSPFSTWCVAFSLYTLGKALSTSVSSALDGTWYALLVILFIIVLAAASIAGVVIDDDAVSRQGTPQPPASEEGAAQGAACSEADPVGADAATSAERPSLPEEELLAATCEAIARDYRLTRREGEILQLLAEGLTASAIAETLVVSTSTAKTHMRNIYQKLGVHAQGELLLLVHRKQ